MSGGDLARLMGDDGAGALAHRSRRRDMAREKKRRAIANMAESRLMMLSAVFIIGFLALGGRMTLLASAALHDLPEATRSNQESVARREITDRHGRILAANIPAVSIYAHPQEMIRGGVNLEEAVELLGEALPDVGQDTLRKRFTPGRKFVWVKRPASPADERAVRGLGLPGVYFGKRDARVYPNGRIGAHLLGGVKTGREWVDKAEMNGITGVERGMDAALKSGEDEPLALSIDFAAQYTLTEVMREAVEQFGAKAGSAVLMKADNGEVLAMVSLPDFDPNNPPDPNDPAVKKDLRMMNRVAGGSYELGSTFKLFAAAQALDDGFYTAQSMIDTRGPIRVGRYKIRDFHKMDPQLSLRDVIVESSNVGTSRIAMAIGPERQKAFLGKLGLLAPVDMEIAEVSLGQPQLPERWSQLASMTISYGHGLAASQLHLATAYASLLNGGLRVKPTLLPGAKPPGEEDRVISADTSRELRKMLRAVVFEEKGTGNFAEVPGYEVGGKTGTADKPKNGGYDRSNTISTFAGAFPMSSPEYVLVITLDEASTVKYGRTWRTAGWTAAPTAGVAVSRLAAVLGMRPKPPALSAETAAEVAGEVRF